MPHAYMSVIICHMSVQCRHMSNTLLLLLLLLLLLYLSKVQYPMYIYNTSSVD